MPSRPSAVPLSGPWRPRACAASRRSAAAPKGAPATKDTEFTPYASALPLGGLPQGSARSESFDFAHGSLVDGFVGAGFKPAPTAELFAPASGALAVSPVALPHATYAPIADEPILADAPPAPATFPALPSGRLLVRTLEALPAVFTLLLITAPFWGGLVIPLPLAIGIVAFDAFWLYLSTSTALKALHGYAQLLRARREDWQARYRADALFGRAYRAWDDVRHIVIIPNYKEPLPTLQRTLQSLADQDVAGQLLVVLAMEAREPGAEAKAQTLVEEFGGCFDDLMVTLHPAGLPGEVVGKSSNEGWAARIARRVYVDERGYEIDDLTISSCDADTIFHPKYFGCLTYKFATHPQRYRRFWQSPILLNNNIWEIPAPLRVGSALSGVHILSNLAKRNRIVFPQSTYSLSLRMADDAGYWDPDVIPEDWHMFLKCFFAFSGEIEVEPIFLPTGNDGVKAATYWRSLKMAYVQHKRHAWGASDIAYTVRQCLAHGEMPFKRKTRRLVALTSNHLIWSTHWFLLTLGWMVPLTLAELLGVKLLPLWLPSVARIFLSLCAAPYVVMIFIDGRLRPPRPASWRRRDSVVAFLFWWLLPVTSLIFSTAPALESQTRLALGKRLEYRVTEKA